MIARDPAGPAGPVAPTGAARVAGPAGPAGPVAWSGSTTSAGPVGPTGAARVAGSAGPAGPATRTGSVGSAGSAAWSGSTTSAGSAAWGAAEAAVDTDGELMTGEAVGLDVRPAGFALRGAGVVIDCIAYLCLFLALLALIQLVAGADASLAAALVVASLVASLVIAPMGVETLSRGRSLGKLAVGARIVRDDGGAIQLRHAFVRALTGVLELYLTFGGIAALVALLSPRSKRLGDLLAGTYSQHERVPRITQPIYAMPPALAEWAHTADAATLPDRLSRRIAAFLRQADAMTPTARNGIAAELAAEAAVFVSPLPAVAPELFLAAVSAVRRDRDRAALALQRRRLDQVRPVLTGLPHGFPDR